MVISFSQFVLSVVVLFAIRLFHRKLTHRPSLPPGPPGLPFLGNIGDLPTRNHSAVYQQWSALYDSDVIRLHVLGTNILVLNSVEAANDLLDERATNYSDRPHLTMFGDLVEMGWVLILVSYGELWKGMRKAIHHSFGPDAVKRYRDVEVKAAHELVQRLVRQPAEFMDHSRHFAGRLFMRVIYGLDVQNDKDRYIESMKEILNAAQAASKLGAFVVDAMPILRYVPSWFPGARFKRQAEAWRLVARKVKQRYFDDAKQHMLEADVSDCGVAIALEHAGDDNENPAYAELLIRTGLGSMAGGGTSTHVSALNTFILAMVLHPEVQQKAQEQIDAVVGGGRLPEFADRPSLTYVTAICHELLRWRPVVTLALPHLSREDDTYRGWFIPRGSLIIPNCRAMLHDESIWENPSQFLPERFLLDGQLNAKVGDLESTAFGFGRRVCPGRFVVRDSIWIAVATVLATMDIRPAVDEHDKPIIPTGDYDEGLVAYPQPFLADIRVRSGDHLSLIVNSSDDS